MSTNLSSALSCSKNRHAVVLGRRGGKKGGKVTALRRSKEERSAAASKAARARWARWRARKQTIPLAPS
jgi:hypothetical protein